MENETKNEEQKNKSTFCDPIKRKEYINSLIPELIRWNFIQNENEFYTRLNEILKCQVIGFDIDFTLAFYRQDNLQELACRGFSKCLIEKEGWPKEELMDGEIPKKIIKEFANLDVIFDFKKGNCIKIDENWTVIKAFHGLHEMKDEEIINSYGKEKKVQEFDLSTINKELGYHYFFDLFTPSYIFLFLKGIDIFEKKEKEKKGSPNLTAEETERIASKIIDQVISTAAAEFGVSNLLDTLDKTNSLYYHEITKNPENFLFLSCKNKILDLLKYLKYDLGKRLFFSTNSVYHYYKFIFEQTMGKEALDLFDLCFFQSWKPKFFNPNSPVSISRINKKTNTLESVTNLTDDLFKNITEDKEKVFAGGNFNFVMEFYDKLFGQAGNRNYLYIGDNIKSDCACIKKIREYGWRSLLIFDELVIRGFDDGVREYDKNYGKKWEDEKKYKNNKIQNGMTILFKNNSVDLALPNIFGLQYILGSNHNQMQGNP